MVMNDSFTSLSFNVDPPIPEISSWMQNLYQMTPKGFIHTKLEGFHLKMTPGPPFTNMD